MLIYLEIGLNCYKYKEIFKNIAIGIVSSSIVSLFITLPNYFNERKKVIKNIISNLCCVYINNSIIINYISYTFTKDHVLNIKILRELLESLELFSKLAVDNFINIENNEYSPFIKFDKFNNLWRCYKDIDNYKNISYNCRDFCSISLRDILRYENHQYKYHNGFLCYKYLENIKSRLLKLSDELRSKNLLFEAYLKNFYQYTKLKPVWQEKKTFLDQQIMEMINFKFF